MIRYLYADEVDRWRIARDIEERLQELDGR